MNLSSLTEVASGIQTCLKEGLALTVSIFFWRKNLKPLLVQHLIRSWQVFFVGPSAHGASVYLSGWQHEGMSKREIQIKQEC